MLIFSISMHYGYTDETESSCIFTLARVRRLRDNLIFSSEFISQFNLISIMGKANKVVVVGMKGVGKTTMLEQLIYGNFKTQDIHPTIEDIYAATVDTDRGTKEMIRFYDTEGFALHDSNHDVAIPKHYHSLADAFVLVYTVNSRQSFEIIDLLKKDIDKNREKREFAAVVVAIAGRPDEKRQVDPSFAVSWATREKIRHFEVSIPERASLVSPFTYLASKLNPPPAKTGFAPLGMVTRKSKD